MKLATLKNETRDGELILVSRDLKSGVSAKDIAPTLQYALDHWDTAHPALKARYALLNENKIKNIFPFETKKVSAPLPRAYQWADASAYVNHVELVRKSRGVTMPESFWTDPLIYQGGSDYFLGPCDDIPIENPDWGIDFEAEIAVITDTIPMGSTANQTGKHIQLLMLVNDISLRNLAPAELAKGFGFFQCKPPTAFSPVAITPDELEDAWDGKKVHLPLLSYYNKKRFGEPNSGTVSNRNYHEVGSSCIVEKRMIETLEQGKPITPFMHYGDTIKIEMQNKRGESIFGEIEQKVIPYVNTL